MSDTPILPEAEIIPPFPAYEVEGVGTVIAHDRAHYVVKMLDGRVCGFRANSGTPSEANAAADIANPAPEPQSVPASVTRRQLFLWLNGLGITRAALRTQLAGNEAALIELEEATEFQRAHPLVAQLGQILGLSAAQIDDAFRNAATL